MNPAPSASPAAAAGRPGAMPGKPSGAMAAGMPGKPGAMAGMPGKPGGRMPGGAPLPPLDYKVVARRGWEYLGRRPWMLVAYIVGSLLTSAVLPPIIALHFGQLTNSTRARPPAAVQSATTAATATATAPAGPAASAPAASGGLLSAEAASELKHHYGFWVGLTVALVALSFGMRYLTASLDVSVSNSLRRSVFLNILRQSPRFFHDHDTGQLTMIVNQFCIEAEIGLRTLLIDPLLQIVGIFAIGATLYRQLSQAGSGASGHQVEWIFAGVGVLALASPWLVSRMGKRLQSAQSLQQQQMLNLSTLITGAISAPEEIQAMRAEGLFDRKHEALLRENFAARTAATLTMEKLNLLNRVPGDVVLFTLLGAAVYFAIYGGGIGPGAFVTVALLTPQFMQAVQALGNFSITMSLRWPSIQLIDSILSSRPTTGEEAVAGTGTAAGGDATAPAGTPAAVRSGDPQLEARHLVFSYEAGKLRNVLDDVSFSLPPGKVTGFIARAGQGKTTFFRLALRFYDPQGGEILLDGHSHASIPVASLRQEIVLMSQFPAFFIDSVRENFRVANADATDEEIERLCRLTPLWDKLQDCFPGGKSLDAPFHAGSPLSGGYKKLFALTRCLLRGPRYLFLDEPTTGMDPEEKFGLIEPMRRNCLGKTTLVVDHDILWQLRFCDHFLVLDHGKIVQQGSGHELLSTPGLFRELFDEQTRGVSDLAGMIETIKTAPASAGGTPPEVIERNLAPTA